MNPLPKVENQPQKFDVHVPVSETNILYFCAVIKPPVYKIKRTLRFLELQPALDKCFELTYLRPIHKIRPGGQPEWKFNNFCFITGVRDRIKLTNQISPGKLRILQQVFNLTNAPKSLIIKVVKERDSFKRHCVILDYQLSHPEFYPEQVH